MNSRILADTDVMIDFLRGYGDAVRLVRSDPKRISLSTVTVAELYAGVKGQAEQEILDTITSRFEILPVTAEIGRLAGHLKQNFGKSHGVAITDALIAATAMEEGRELATLNVKHFQMFKGLKPAYTKA